MAGSKEEKKLYAKDSGTEDRSALYRIAKGLNQLVNLMAILLFTLLLLYAGHSLWYSHSLQNESFLSEELAQYRPDGQEPSLAEIRKINPDVTAWIRIDGTNIDYPVVQGEDDSEYLNKSVLDEYSLAGALFMSASNHPDFSDPYNMIYGHHIEGGAMFADILEFRDASFFKNHATGTLWYPEQNGEAGVDRIEIFASLSTAGDDEVVYADPSWVTSEELQRTVDYILERASQQRPVMIDPNSRVVALSTCEDAVSFNRVLLFGKLVPMTKEEILAMQAEEEVTESSHKTRGWLPLLKQLPSWILPSAGALLIAILLVLIGKSLLTKRRHNKEWSQE